MTLPVYHPAHKHNPLYVQCLQACIDGKPLIIEFSECGNAYREARNECDTHTPIVSWLEQNKYRIKPPEPVMITQTVTYPAPMKEAPKTGTKFWLVSTVEFQEWQWIDSKDNWLWLKAGVCFATQADAQACWNALFGSQS